MPSPVDRAKPGSKHQVVTEGHGVPLAVSLTGVRVGSCRRELLDRTSVWNQRHLMIVLREYEDFYNTTGRTAP